MPQQGRVCFVRNACSCRKVQVLSRLSRRDIVGVSSAIRKLPRNGVPGSSSRSIVRLAWNKLAGRAYYLAGREPCIATDAGTNSPLAGNTARNAGSSISDLLAAKLEELVRERKGHDRARKRALARLRMGLDLGWKPVRSREKLHKR